MAQPRLYALVIALMVAGTAVASGQSAEQSVTFPARASASDYVVDAAKLLEPGHATSIAAVSRKLAADHRIPIVVVTVESMAKHGVASDDIATYSRSLFDDWGIGHAHWNRGILIVVSVADRKARIELGADWRLSRQAATKRVMQDRIIPHFKQGRFSLGIYAGVLELDYMAREWADGTDSASPAGPSAPYVATATEAETGESGPDMWIVALMSLLGLALVAWTIVSIRKDGTSGGAWQFWSLVFKILALLVVGLLAAAANSSSSSSSGSTGSGGGGWGGGSGGGSGGGGGSTGSW